MTNPIVDLDVDQLRKLLNLGAAFAAANIAADVLERAAFDSDDAEALTWLPLSIRMETVARLLDCADAMREELRQLDAVLLGFATAEA